MRTLDELKTLALNGQKEFAKRAQEAAAKVQEMSRLAEAAQSKVDEASNNGDFDAYSKAKSEVSYYLDQVKIWKSRSVESVFSVDEHNEIVRETNEALKAANAPLYGRLIEIIDEWNDIVKKLDSNCAKSYSIDISLYHARDTKDKTGMMSNQWKKCTGGMNAPDFVTKQFDPVRTSVRREIMTWYIPKNKEV